MSILRIEVFGTNYTHLVTNTFRSVWEYVGVQQYCLPNDKYSVDKTVHHGGTIGG